MSRYFTKILILTLMFVILIPVKDRAFCQMIQIDELAKKIQDMYDQMNDFTAEFRQSATIRSVNRTVTEEGVLFLKKPNRMLWNYTEPSSKKMVINPDKSWLFVPDDNIVYVQETEKLLTSKMMIKFLTGIGNLKNDFDLSYCETSPVDENGNYRLNLRPKEYEAGISNLLLTINKESYYIMKCQLTDMYDNVTILIFKNMKINKKLPDDMFIFSPPEGTEIYMVP